MYCRKCGQKLDDQGSFCTRCGTSILHEHRNIAQSTYSMSTEQKSIKYKISTKVFIVAGIMAILTLIIIILTIKLSIKENTGTVVYSDEEIREDMTDSVVESWSAGDQRIIFSEEGTIRFQNISWGIGMDILNYEVTSDNTLTLYRSDLPVNILIQYEIFGDTLYISYQEYNITLYRD